VRWTFLPTVTVLLGLVGVMAAATPAVPPCNKLPVAQRETARLAGRCSGPAPIIDTAPKVSRVPVPDLRGRLFDPADARLANFVVVVSYREGADRRNWVLDQRPRPPARLSPGGDLTLVLSDGTLVRVPNVRGAYARALALLHRSGLTWTNADQGVAQARVVGQSPEAGTAVRPGSEVTLRLGSPLALAPGPPQPQNRPPAPVAQTPAPSESAPRPAARQTPMPNVMGLQIDDAVQRLPTGDVQRVIRAGTEAAGTVIGQTPAAGASLADGASIRLVLSDGSLVKVPRVKSFSVGEARQRLAAQGGLRPVITEVASDVRAGTVLMQRPAEGEIAGRGSVVQLQISKGRVIAPKKETAPPAAADQPTDRTEAQTPSRAEPAPIAVPKVIGQSQQASTSALAGFRVESTSVASAEPAGRVIAQDPAPGTALGPGATVRLQVSDGSLARSAAQPPLAEAPPVSARSWLGEAQIAVQRALARSAPTPSWLPLALALLGVLAVLFALLLRRPRPRRAIYAAPAAVLPQFEASARLERGTGIATAATPRGPEITVQARLERGTAVLREHGAAPAATTETTEEAR
jgi:beta-lactam-binding protein with PASTA domain